MDTDWFKMLEAQIWLYFYQSFFFSYKNLLKILSPFLVLS